MTELPMINADPDLNPQQLMRVLESIQLKQAYAQDVASKEADELRKKMMLRQMQDVAKQSAEGNMYNNQMQLEMDKVTSRLSLMKSIQEAMG